MEKLREYFAENRSLIDIEMPSMGHFNRFNRKLDRLHQTEGKSRLMIRTAIAAAVLVPFVYISILISNKTSDKYVPLGSVSNEFRETQMYFETQLTQRLVQVDNLVDYKVISREDILNDLDEMDNYYMGLQHDLATNPNDERIVQAMILYYQQKIELLDMILGCTAEYKTESDATIISI